MNTDICDFQQQRDLSPEECRELLFTVSMTTFGGMNKPLYKGNCYQSARDIVCETLIEARKNGQIVHLLERGKQWEIEPDPLFIVGDDSGVINLDHQIAEY